MLSLAWQSTRKHQTNNSHSKSTFAFGKDSRFRGEARPLCDSFYNIPSRLGQSPASGIGKGSKTQVVNANVFTPSPQNYHLKASIGLGKKGIKFGQSRDKMKHSGIFQKSQTPEPGHYQKKSEFETKKGFTIYSKLALPVFSNTKNPGPGHYKSSQSLTSEGRYVLSQLTNCPGYKIKPTKPCSPSQSNPGPGQYTSNGENLNASGRYYNSRHENSRCRSFSKSSKHSSAARKVPGPGSYNYYSEFGSKI